MLQEKKAVKVRVIESGIITTNYGIDVFQNLPINRELKPANINKLVKAFRIVEPCGVSVLTVIRTGAWNNGTKTDYLCDGHNRRAAALKYAKEFGSPVRLTFNIIEIDGEDTIENIYAVLQTINVNLGTWSPKDYTTTLSKLNEDYKEFSRLSLEYKGFKLGESTMLEILALGTCTMKQYKEKQFKIVNKEKSYAILHLISEIGFNEPRKQIFDKLPHTHIKRALFKQLAIMETTQINEAVSKIQEWLENNTFSYQEQTFREELESIFNPKVETTEIEEAEAETEMS